MTPFTKNWSYLLRNLGGFMHKNFAKYHCMLKFIDYDSI